MTQCVVAGKSLGAVPQLDPAERQHDCLVCHRECGASVLLDEQHGVGAEAAAALNATRRAGGRIVAVGSTALRVLESAAADDAAAFSGETALFITPGYRFRAVDAMLTNFHLPRCDDLVHAGMRLLRP